MQETFTSIPENDTISILDNMEEEEMLSRYHFENVIYLYGIFEKEVAYQITGTNSAKMPLTLYETPMTAFRITGKHIQNPVALRFAVDISLKDFTYDELIEESKRVMKKSGLKQEDFINKCLYTRRYNTKEKVIIYTINDSSLIINVQNL